MLNDSKDLVVLTGLNALRDLIQNRNAGTENTEAERKAAFHLNQVIFDTYATDPTLCCLACKDCAACDNGDNCKLVKQFMESTIESRLDFAKRLMLENKLSPSDANDQAYELYSNFLLADIN
jgi:hypothetical protein